MNNGRIESQRLVDIVNAPKDIEASSTAYPSPVTVSLPSESTKVQKSARKLIEDEEKSEGGIPLSVR